MKRNNVYLYSFFLCIMFCCCDTNAIDELKQVKMYEEGKTWLVFSIPNCCPNLGVIDSIYFECAKDGTRKLHQSRRVINDPDGEYKIQREQFFSFKETDDGKVYINNSLYYDFSLKDDDLFGNKVTGYWRVARVDTVDYLGRDRKVLTLKSRCSSDTLLWIDGLGSDQGLIYQGGCLISTDNMLISIEGIDLLRTLVSVKDKNDYLFHNSEEYEILFQD